MAREHRLEEGSKLVGRMKKRKRKVKWINMENPWNEMWWILFLEISRNRSNTMSHMSLGPSTFGMSRPSSIRQADSLPMGKGTLKESLIFHDYPSGYRVETTNRFMSLASQPVTVQRYGQDILTCMSVLNTFKSYSQKHSQTHFKSFPEIVWKSW